MTILRRFLAGICFVLGVIALALWGVSALVVKGVEDGTFVTSVAKKVLDQPQAKSYIAERTQALVNSTLTANGVDVAKYGLQGQLDDLVAATVTSTVFQDAIAQAVDAARAGIADQLTSDASEGRPLTISLDVSATLKRAIDGTPGLAGLVPNVTFQPLTYDVADANTFGKIRNVYSWIHTIASWAGWIGLALIAAGIALTPRKRWLIPLGLLWAGLSAGAVWAVLQFVTVDRLVGRLPGGADGELGSALTRVARQETLDSFASKALLVAVVCLVGAVLAYILVKVLTGSSRDDDRRRGQHDDRAPEHAR